MEVGGADGVSKERVAVAPERIQHGLMFQEGGDGSDAVGGGGGGGQGGDY